MFPYELSAGASSPVVFSSGLAGPEYMAIGATGELYVPEYYGADVRLIGTNGVSEGVLVSGLANPSSVALVAAPEPVSTGAAAVLLPLLAMRQGRERADYESVTARL